MREESSESFDTINDLRAVRYTLGQTKPHQNSVSFFPNKSALFAHIATRYPLYPILQNQIAWIPTYYKWIPTALVTLRNFTFIPYKKTVRTVEQPLKSLKKSPHFTTWRRATFIFKVLTLLKMHKERKEQKQLHTFNGKIPMRHFWRFCNIVMVHYLNYCSYKFWPSTPSKHYTAIF